MPGNFRKVPRRGTQKATSKSDAKHKSIPASPVPRPISGVIRRSTNLNRLGQRAARRVNAQHVAEQVQNRPRHAVRPSQPPRKIMPAVPAPARAKPAPRTPIRAPQAASSRRTRPQPAKPQHSNAGSLAAAAAGAAVISLAAVNLAAAHQEISAEVSTLQRDLDDLGKTSTLAGVQRDVANIDSALRNALDLLEGAREKGFRYQKDLEEIAYQTMSQWEVVKPQVESAVVQRSREMNAKLAAVNPQINSLNSHLGNPSAAAAHLRTTQTKVNQLLQEAETIERNIEQSYNQIESQTHELNRRLTRIHWALEQLDEARFELNKEENLVMGVPARWDQKDKDDPEGVLFLTNRRLVFERKEKVATKKVLFITTASELVQEVLIDQPLNNLSEVQASSRGLFGHQDFLEVTFADAALGRIAFHLDGQDSEGWAGLIGQAKSGKIEDDRASGSKLSFTDLTKPLAHADLIAVQNEVNELQDELMLKEVRAELEQLENEVRNLERSLVGVRARGYAIEPELEADLQVLIAQWERVKRNAETTLEGQARLLSAQQSAIQHSLAQLLGKSGDLAAARPLYVQLKSAIASAEAQADAAETTVFTQFDQYADEVESLAAHLAWIDWMLEALATASFRLLATESGVAATDALWEAPGREAENGILFLTDQRLLWEDRQGDYELKVDIPLQQVGKVVNASGDANDAPALSFDFESGAQLPNARFRLTQPVADDWLLMVGRARSGEYVQARAIPVDTAELERVRSAPQQCSNCGAAFTAPILRGQTELECEYCGLVTRI